MNDKKVIIYKQARTAAENASIDFEVKILHVLENKIQTCLIPQVLDYSVSDLYAFSYEQISGVTLSAEFYKNTSNEMQDLLAQDLAGFFFELHHALSISDASKLGIVKADWPFDAAWLSQRLKNVLQEDWLKKLFENFIQKYTAINFESLDIVVLHHDMHGGNILCNQATGRLQGIIDFADVSIGDPYLDFRLLWLIDKKLAQKVAFYYAQKYLKPVDLDRIEFYYLATEFSRFAQALEDNEKSHTIASIKERLNKIL